MAHSEATPEILQKLVERFARARWITDINLVTSEKIHLFLTQHGKRRFADLFRIFNSLVGEKAPELSERRATDKLRLILELAEVIEELGPPVLSRAERDTVLGLALVFGEEPAHSGAELA